MFLRLCMTSLVLLCAGCIGLPFAADCTSLPMCEPGLECLEGVASKSGLDDSCTPSEFLTCTRSCTDDSDCADLEDGVCEETCTEGKSTCVKMATSDLPLGSHCTDNAQCLNPLACMQGPLVTGETSCGEICSVSCDGDDACIAQDPEARCMVSCDGQPRVCIKVVTP